MRFVEKNNISNKLISSLNEADSVKNKRAKVVAKMKELDQDISKLKEADVKNTTEEGEEYDSFIYQLVGGKLSGEYTLEELKQLPIYTGEDSGENTGRRKELKHQPILKDYLGPMWNGIKNGKGVIRYETQEMYDALSEADTSITPDMYIIKDYDIIDDRGNKLAYGVLESGKTFAANDDGYVYITKLSIDELQDFLENPKTQNDMDAWNDIIIEEYYCEDENDDVGKFIINQIWPEMLNEEASTDDYTRRNIQKVLVDETDNYAIKIENRTKNVETNWLDVGYNAVLNILNTKNLKEAEDISFEEIITAMENAETYEDLYNAANDIVDAELRQLVLDQIQICEDDGDDVGTAYSIVTSDLLDSRINDLNEAEVTNLNLVKNQGNVYMFEAKGHDFTHIVGENYNKEDKVLENAKTYNNKNDADNDYMQRCGISLEESANKVKNKKEGKD